MMRKASLIGYEPGSLRFQAARFSRYGPSAYRAGAGPGKTGRLSWPSRSTAATAKK